MIEWPLMKTAAIRNLILSIVFAFGSTAMPGHAESTPSPKPDVGEGRVAWFDLTTTDIAKAKEFYGKLFGWQFIAVKGTDRAAEIVAGGTPIGTIRMADGKISPFNGVVYIQVSDLPGCCQKAKGLGATIVPGFPFDLPDSRGAIGLLTDTSGHPLGLYSRTSLPAASTAK
jgi:predicted enzyme related to lactoylglutathione lyase